MKTLNTTAYTGIFMRQSGDETPVSPVPNADFWDGPDLIFAAKNPLKDKGQSYAADYNLVSPNEIDAGSPNYVYIRAINSNTITQNARVWLYYMPANLILFPNQWNYQGIISSQFNSNYINLVNQPVTGQPFVANDYFIFAPPAGSPDHYCLVGWIDNNPDFSQADPVQPSSTLGPIPQTPSGGYAFYCQNINAVQRNSTTINPTGGGTTWSNVDYIPTMGDCEFFMLGILGKNIDLNSNPQISFSVVAGGTEIGSYPITPIKADPFCFVLPFQKGAWPANANGSISFTYTQDATATKTPSINTTTIVSDSSAISALENIGVNEERINQIINSTPVKNVLLWDNNQYIPRDISMHVAGMINHPLSVPSISNNSNLRKRK